MKSILPCLALVAMAACADNNDAHLYYATPYAPSYTSADVANLQHLGANLTDQGVNFATYSRTATKMQLALFANSTDQLPARQIEMTRFGDVWSVYVEGVGLNQLYGYIAWGPNWTYDPAWYPGAIYGFHADVDADGNRFDPNKLLIDPYCRQYDRDFDWSSSSPASGPQRAESTFAAETKCLITQNSYAWSENETAWRAMRASPNPPVGHRAQDLVVYETHPKGASADSASGAQHPGTFRGLGEIAPYFADLGVTAIEIMPTFEREPGSGYWAYNTMGFFAPAHDLAYSQQFDEPISEFKWMVDQLHQNGVEVLLDVVYNHTGEGGLWQQVIQFSDASLDPVAALGTFDPKEIAGIYSFRGLDNQSYYALSPDSQTYWDNSGVGQDTRCNNTPMRKLIVDSLEYWVGEMHIDGFRFDLGPVLGEVDMNYNSQAVANTTVLQDIVEDPVLQQYNARLFAEPWSLNAFMIYPVDPTASNAATQSSYWFPSSQTKDSYAWGEWNGPFRDWWRSFLNIDNWALNSQDDGVDFGALTLGSSLFFQANSRNPFNSANFVTIHDGFTMYDLFAYNTKVNGCGPLNPICCTNPLSSFCDESSGESDNRSRDWRLCSDSSVGSPQFCTQDSDCGSGNSCNPFEEFKRQQMRNLFVAMLMSNGTPLLLGGDEWERTQLGNNNAYSDGADNPYNWYQWGDWQPDQPRNRMHDFVRQLIHWRLSRTDILAPATYGAAPNWLSEAGTSPPNWGGRHLAILWPATGSSPQTEILVNMEGGNVNYTLPPGTWNRIVDTQLYFDTDTYVAGQGLNPMLSNNINTNAAQTSPVSGSYGVQGHSIVILEAAP